MNTVDVVLPSSTSFQSIFDGISKKKVFYFYLTSCVLHCIAFNACIFNYFSINKSKKKNMNLTIKKLFSNPQRP